MNTPLDSISPNEWDKLIVSILRPMYSFCKNDVLVTPDDLQQEAWIALLAASERYDASKAKFTTYAYYYIRGHVMRYVAQRTKNKPGLFNESQLDTTLKSEPCKTSQDLLETVDHKDVSDTIFSKIGDQEHADLLVEHFVNNKSMRQIARERGVSHEAIATRVRKLIDILHMRMKHENA